MAISYILVSMDSQVEDTPDVNVEPPKRLIVLGSIFMVVWLVGACAVLVTEAFVSLMANDSGRMSNTSHLVFLVLFLGGQVINMLAAIPGGQAIFKMGMRRKQLWRAFFSFLGAGLSMQLAGVLYLVLLVGAS